MSDVSVIIIGGGVAGLACAMRLQEAGVEPLIIEASYQVGGRVRTDAVEGFLLDRGFQVLLTAYPEARRVLNLAALGLRPFYPGALIRKDGRFMRLGDPWRRPWDTFATLSSRAGTLWDKLRIAQLRAEWATADVDAIFSRPETTTADALRKSGLSEQIMGSFFRPFLRGIFLDPELATSSHMLAFVMRMFVDGSAALPARGIGAIPDQIALTLRPGAIRTNARVTALRASGAETLVHLSHGEVLAASSVVVATEAPEALLLTDVDFGIAAHGVTCVYFAAEAAPIEEPILVLDGDGGGLVNNLCVPSAVSRSYAPAGAHLVSASVVGVPSLPDGVLEATIREQMTRWFGQAAERWRHLRTYRIPYALPSQDPPLIPGKPVRVRRGLYLCGDHRETSTLNGALVSGRRAAETLLEDQRG